MANVQGGNGDLELELQGEDMEGRQRTARLEGPKAKWRQHFAAVIAHLGAVTMATIWSYSSTALPSLREDVSNGDFGNITATDEAWVASITFLAGAVGGPFVGPLADLAGLRASLLIINIPMLLGWLMVVFAPSMPVILVGRFITGFFVSGVGISGVLIAELSHEDRRGRLNYLLDMMFCVGVLFIYLVGTFTHWRVQAGLCGGFCVLHFVLLLLIPESPTSQMRKGRQEGAEDAVRWMRDLPNVEEEVQQIRDAVDEENLRAEAERVARGESLNLCSTLATKLKSFFCSAAVLKPVFLGICIQFFLQVCGVVPIVCYAVDVFKAAGMNIHENMSTIVFGAVNLLATIVAYLFVDRVGRRKLFIGSELGLTVSLVAIGIFLYAKTELGYADVLKPFSWVLLFWFIIYIIAYSFGVGPLPWVIIGEILEPRFKGTSSGVINIATRVFGFLVMFYFKDLMNVLGQPWVYWGFAGVCFSGAIFALFILPETKGRTLDEIQGDLRGSWCVGARRRANYN